MPSSSTLAFCLLLTVSLGSPSPLSGQVASLTGGTYTILLCRPTCSAAGSDTLARGRIAFFAEPLDSSRLVTMLAGLSTRAPELLQSTWEVYPGQQPPNMCYVYDINPGRSRSHGAIHRGALGAWVSRGDSALIDLYQSPDAWHHAKVAVTTEGFTGIGFSSGAAHVMKIEAPDFVEGRRISTAVSTVCSDAARAINQ